MRKRAAIGHTGRAPSQRQLRVGETLRHALSELLARGTLRDPDVAGQSITVSEVRVSPDMRAATVFVYPLGGGDCDAVLAGLRRAAPYLSTRLGQSVRLRNTPRLDFRADPTFDQASRVEHLLHRPTVARDLARAGASEDDPGGDR